MRKSFDSYYRPRESEFSELWQKCLFILDANVLLNLYRYSKATRDDLLQVFKKVSDRLWIPHQAALEYQENRLGVIAEQVKRYDEVVQVLTGSQNKLRTDLENLQLKKRHSAIDPDHLLAKVGNIFDEFRTELENLKKEQPDVFDNDELREQLDLLFDGKVGIPPKSQDILDKIYEEGEVRYKRQQPPGYLDQDKVTKGEDEIYIYNGMVFKRKYGDLILWKQIIEKAKTREDCQHIIFITDDAKEDWWWVIDSKGKKTIGPRHELIEEISSEAGLSAFYMYDSERFLTFAKKYLGVQVKQESIDQIRDVSILNKANVQRSHRFPEAFRLVEEAVLEWIRIIHSNNLWC